MSRRKEYRLGVLSPTRITALEAITGWEWNRTTPPGTACLPHLDQAAHHHGTVAHITQTTVIDGANIGHRVMTQRTRHRQDRLTPDRAGPSPTSPTRLELGATHGPPTARIHSEPANTK